MSSPRYSGNEVRRQYGARSVFCRERLIEAVAGKMMRHSIRNFRRERDFPAMLAMLSINIEASAVQQLKPWL
jgi:hypothetical protein